MNSWGTNSFDDGYETCRTELAHTLTRLRATIKDLDSPDDRAYVRALNQVADTHSILARTEEVVRYTA